MGRKVAETYQDLEEVSTEIDSLGKKRKLPVMLYNIIGKKKSSTDNAFTPNTYYGDEIIEIKQKLNWLGYEGLPETAFDESYTMKTVKQFQIAHGLFVNGKINDETKEKIDDVFSGTFRLNSNHEKIKDLKILLNKVGFGGIQVTSTYGNFTDQRVREFQEYYGLPVTGRASIELINKINEILSSPFQVDNYHKDIVALKQNLNALGYGKIKTTEKFGKLTERKVKKFQKDYNLPISGIADEKTMEKIESARKFTEKYTYVQYDMVLDEAVNIQKSLEPEHKYANLHESLNPKTILGDKKRKLKFLDLTRPNVASVSQLDNCLKSKGILEDKAKVFKEAAVKAGINELYLISEVLLGMEDYPKHAIDGFPVDNQGKITYVEKKEEDRVRFIPGESSETSKWVFNIFGTSIFGSMSDCAKKAFEEGWDSVEKAIIGGADFIRQTYITNDYNTFYNMRWKQSLKANNVISSKPNASEEWITKQIETIYKLYDQLDSYNLYLEIPVYKDNQ